MGIFVGAFGSFQWPAYSAAVTLMMKKKNYARASAMLGIAQSISGILGPPLAAVLLAIIAMHGVLTINLFTLVFAMSMLLICHVPQPSKMETKKDAASVFKDQAFGFKYILERKPLLGLQLTFFTFNLLSAFGLQIMAPMILARTHDSSLALGSVQAAASVGGFVGGIGMIIWGGPKRRITGLLGGMVAGCAVGSFAFTFSDPLVWMLGAFGFVFFMPILNGCSQAIWQSRVAPELQGRVFGARMFIAQCSNLIGMLAVGPVADRVFEPAMLSGGGLTGAFGWLIAPGPGSGMTLMLSLSCILCIIVAIIAYSINAIRNVETLVPDFDAGKKGESEESAEKERSSEPGLEKTV
jgi:MFS family permease